MSMHTTIRNEFGNAEQGVICSISSFGAMLRESLGETNWLRLDREIRQRFSGYISNNHPLRFAGKMQWVYCSPIGMVIAKLIKRFAILPDVCARHCDFTFDIGAANTGFSKQRGYTFGRGRRFVFSSLFTDLPRLHEEFGGGLGMYLRLAAKRGSLLFRDEGYFLRILNWRLRLPDWLTPGRFELLHRNIDAQRFQVIIRVAHPLFGTLFYQRGEFKSVI